ncbi:response regulator [Scytonema sp. UIC 10036]|uniref:response regulator n=1 Tax=Scytonema sp. UIC 10036 TaxID=2304196 RepID=UPI0012DABE50|nr:response regulator [Scytonema sp. UIC 10036]MUG99084.1 response regulator [Scytonema sp. UIC 10036]
MPGNSYQPLLIVEDSDEDFDLLQRFLQEASLENPIYRCFDGDEALAFLFRKGHYADPDVAPCPSLILLDLNLPGTDGREVIRQIKADTVLKVMPVVVLSSSSNPKDIDFCYKVGANAYYIKPTGLKKLRHLIQVLVEAWFNLAVSPSITKSK